MLPGAACAPQGVPREEQPGTARALPALQSSPCTAESTQAAHLGFGFGFFQPVALNLQILNFFRSFFTPAHQELLPLLLIGFPWKNFSKFLSDFVSSPQIQICRISAEFSRISKMLTRSFVCIQFSPVLRVW